MTLEQFEGKINSLYNKVQLMLWLPQITDFIITGNHSEVNKATYVYLLKALTEKKAYSKAELVPTS